eukprot:10793214-Lingulodinium_polyedra.AAC.1
MPLRAARSSPGEPSRRSWLGATTTATPLRPDRAKTCSGLTASASLGRSTAAASRAAGRSSSPSQCTRCHATISIAS